MQEHQIAEPRSPRRASSPRKQVQQLVCGVLSEPGKALDAGLRARMDASFGYDFSAVRVHADGAANRSADALSARAYTVGSHIAFRANDYRPGSPDGDRLIAHELAHVIQQGNVADAASKDIVVAAPHGPFEGEAERLAEQAARAPRPQTSSERHATRDSTRGLDRPSPAVSPRAQLRTAAPGGAVTLQRLKTSGGDWYADCYDLKTDINQEDKYVKGARGVEIMLHFNPGPTVDAQRIGLVQTAQSYKGSENQTISGAGIPKDEAIRIDTGPKDTDEGTHIDRKLGPGNPIYGNSSTPSTSLADNAMDCNGQLGVNYTDRAGRPWHQEAWLKDRPTLLHATTSSRQVFETTAIATAGTQKGTYYGSVRWGWRTDGAGKHSKIELQKVSDGVPSSTFLRSALLWNADETAKHVELLVPHVWVTTQKLTLILPDSQPSVVLDEKTRLVKLGSGLSGLVKVVDGPHVGAAGDIGSTGLTHIRRERS